MSNNLTIANLDAGRSVKTTTIEETSGRGKGDPNAIEKQHLDRNTLIQDTERLASKILGIIASYGTHYEQQSGRCDALEDFFPLVAKSIYSSSPVQIILPAFPFKDPSQDLVLGHVPDLGEELALAHLQSLCSNISAAYEHGAELFVCSDGLVYNDLMGLSDETAWEYGQAVRDMAVRKRFHDLNFLRLWDVLDYLDESQPDKYDEVASKKYYLDHAARIRQDLLRRYSFAHFDVKVAEATDQDKDAMAPEIIAEQMITREKAYGAALRSKFPNHIRLSIHDSSGVDKLSLALIPGAHKRGTVGLMPWRSAIAIGADGSYRAVYPDKVRDTYDLVYRNEQPYFYRFKSNLFDWEDANLQVEFEHLYPCGLIIRPRSGSPSMTLIPIQKVRHLSHQFSPIVLRGFSETMVEDTWVRKGHELGDILSWTVTGTIFNVVNSRDGSKTANDSISNEPVPSMHFDRVFNFPERKRHTTGEITKVLSPPWYQYFTCLAIAPEGDGYTLFCSSRLLFRHLSWPWSLDGLRSVTWKMTNDGVREKVHKEMPLVVNHPVTGAPCIRWPSLWDVDTAKYSRYTAVINNELKNLLEVVEQLAYDFRTCLRFSWERGDILVSDNVAMLHTRA